MTSYHTRKRIGLVRLSNLKGTQLTKKFQISELESFGVDEIFTDNAVSVNFKISVADRLEELGLLAKLGGGSELVVTSLSRIICNDKRLYEFLDFCRRALITLIAIKEGINCHLKDFDKISESEVVLFPYLKSLEMRVEGYKETRDELSKFNTRNVEHNGARGVSLIKCWYVAKALREAGANKAEVAKQLNIQRGWIYSNKLHLRETQDKYLALAPEQLRKNDPLLKRQILKELGF